MQQTMQQATDQTMDQTMDQTTEQLEREEVLHVHIEEAGYEPNQHTIKDVSFSIRPGELIGLIGPNGAGKSTTIKAIIGLLDHMKGTVAFKDERASYAYIPEKPIMYDEMTLWEHLQLAAAAYEMDEADFEHRAHELLAHYRLDHVKHKYPAQFSKGMQQKMMLILSFLIRSELYIIDEPFVGLDPHATKDFLNMLDEERSRGAGVLMSTHVLDTAEKICDSFILLTEGTIVAQGTLEHIREQCGMPDASLFDCFHHLSRPEGEGAAS